MSETGGGPLRALILSGGGARGAYEAGVIKALFAEERFDIVCGTSIGAINGALAAQGAIDALADLWSGIAQSSVVRLVPRIRALQDALLGIVALARDPFLRRGGALARVVRALGRIGALDTLLGLNAFFDHTPLLAFLERNLRASALERTLIVTATDLTSGDPAAFYAFRGDDALAHERTFVANEPGSKPITDATYVAAIRASSSIPLAYEPVIIADELGDRRAYVDGGLANNTPIRQAIDAGATDITLILLDHPPLQNGDVDASGFADVGLTSFGVMQRRVLELDLKLARSINESVRRGAAPEYRFVNIRTISPSVPFELAMLGFNRQQLVDEAFALGIADGHAATRVNSFLMP